MNWHARFVRPLAGLVLLIPMLGASPASATVRYRISLDHPEQHTFRIEMAIPNLRRGTAIALPAWNALYQIRDFAYRVRDVRLVSPPADGSRWELRKIDKQSWQVGDPSGMTTSSVVVRYSIEWNDPGPFNSQMNSNHAFINFAELLMYVPGRQREDTEVAFENVPLDWGIATELPEGTETSSFTADSYDALVDAPAEAGRFAKMTFEQDGAQFRVVVDSRDGNLSTLEDYLRRITSYELRLMGGPPFKQYTFFFHIGPYEEVGGGGMEHSNSTAIAASSIDSAASIAAHEFFHAWNVKRIRPQTLEPVDYAHEQYTRALWFAEGVTSTYAAYALERCGLWSKEQFYTNLASQISELESRPAHNWQSVEESSIDAWLEKYDLYAQPDRSISYYNKGQIIGVLLDLAIRNATSNHRSLDDVLRRMNEEYAKRGKFYNESEGIRTAVEEVAGQDFEEFFHALVAGTAPLPYDALLGAAGLTLKIEVTKTVDPGFSLGSALNQTDSVTVESGSTAETAGLRDGDVILDVNGREFSTISSQWPRGFSAGENVTVRIRREGADRKISFPLGLREERRYSILEAPVSTDLQRRIRSGLLHGATD